MDKISMDKCIKGRVYKIRSRNLIYGVYDGNGGFIGIRDKFDSRFLFTEFHWDQGPPYGTVGGQEDLGIDVPENIKIAEGLGSFDQRTNRPVSFGDINNIGENHWYYTDTNEIDDEIMAYPKKNIKLFKFLKKIEDDDYINMERGKFELLMKNKYPKLYYDLYGDPRRTCMAFGFEVNNGWFPLIADLSRELNNLHEDGLYVAQVKEKFGELRVYVSAASEEAFKITEKYEELSSKICERCGDKGKIRNSGWLVTLCDSCEIKKEGRC